MNIAQLAQKLKLEILSDAGGIERNVGGVYCGDLLSIVMGQAKQDDVWITVMGNINAVAVATLTEVSAILLAHNATMDTATIDKAKQEHIWVLRSREPVFALAQKVAALAHLAPTESEL